MKEVRESKLKSRGHLHPPEQKYYQGGPDLGRRYWSPRDPFLCVREEQAE